MKNILITGGAGFIGSHVLRLFVKTYPNYNIFNIDKLTYAGNLQNIDDIKTCSNYNFIHGDITNKNFIDKIFKKHKFDSVIHLAAESHVDRSINNPMSFVRTNVLGTVTLLDAFVSLWNKDFNDKLFYHVSTDEVYGSLEDIGYFTELSPYSPNSPYSASKASSDHFVRAYSNTYGMPYVISNCSNNYGPNQFPEKLIPLFIKNIIDKKTLPVYGHGNNTRDWLFVLDHASAIDKIFHSGIFNQTYNIGGHNEVKNIDLVHMLCNEMDIALGNPTDHSLNLIKYVQDRKGHDLRYAIDSTKISDVIGWVPSVEFKEGLKVTIQWYLNNKHWLDNISDKSYMNLKKNL